MPTRFDPDHPAADEPTLRKALAFRALHERAGAFIIPNPWDVGSARVLARLGFEALASTSAGFAFTLGLQDNRVGRDAMLAHVATLVRATELPLSADLENGFGDTPEAVAQTLALAAATGIVGGSIEDATGRADDPIYPLGLAVDRIRAAVETVRALPHPFVLTARAENHLVGRADLKDTIVRLQAYQEAGADVLYAPGITRAEDIATLVAAVDRPVNVLMGMAGAPHTQASLAALGVRRISVGSGLARAALGAFMRAAREMREHGSFRFADEAIGFGEISGCFEP